MRRLKLSITVACLIVSGPPWLAYSPTRAAQPQEAVPSQDHIDANCLPRLRRPGSRLRRQPGLPTNDTDSFIQEALLLRAYGGPDGRTCNRINSPGESILKELDF